MSRRGKFAEPGSRLVGAEVKGWEWGVAADGYEVFVWGGDKSIVKLDCTDGHTAL